MSAVGDLVCAKCGVYCRKLHALYDEDGNVFQTSTVCAYCGRSELRFKLPEGEEQAGQARFAARLSEATARRSWQTEPF